VSELTGSTNAGALTQPFVSASAAMATHGLTVFKAGPSFISSAINATVSTASRSRKRHFYGFHVWHPPIGLDPQVRIVAPLGGALHRKG